MNLDAFEARALPHLDAVYRLAMVLVDDALDASRLVQQTYRRAMDAADQIAHEDPEFRLSLLRILRALVAADARGSKYVDADLHACAASVDVRRARDHDGLIREAIGRFPARYRSTLLLWSVENLTDEQIAEIEDVPATIVRGWLQDARRVLHDLLAPVARPGDTPAAHSSGPVEHPFEMAQEVNR